MTVLFQRLKDFIGLKYWEYKTLQLRKPLKGIKVLTIEETIDLVVENKLSVSRYGDGEFILMLGIRSIVFQELDFMLQKRLKEVIASTLDNHLVCINSALIDRSGLKRTSKNHWIEFANKYAANLMNYMPIKNYGNALISRFYHHKKDKKNVPNLVRKLKLIWQDRDILFVEGHYSRLGVGNDLFSNAKSCKRILCPPNNAFNYYDSIYQKVMQHYNEQLVIIALGPTATVLAYDLSKKGVQALDLGHIDIEYSWFIQGATERVAIKGKLGGETTQNIDLNLSESDRMDYEKSIIATIDII